MQRNDSILFDLQARATEISVREVLLTIHNRLIEAGYEPDLMDRISIALAEAANNIVEHAYADYSGEIRVLVRRAGQHLHFELRDKGAPMPGNMLPDGRAADLDVGVQDLPEGGFGWFLIHELTDGLRYDRKGDENILTVSFELPAETAP